MDPAEAADRLRHDLGKYVAFSLRFVEPEASDGELREALRDDLLRTRRGADGESTVAEVWAGLRPLLVAIPAAGGHVAALDGHVAALHAGAARLDGLDRPALDELAAGARSLAAAARKVADELRRLGD